MEGRIPIKVVMAKSVIFKMMNNMMIENIEIGWSQAWARAAWKSCKLFPNLNLTHAARVYSWSC